MKRIWRLLIIIIGIPISFIVIITILINIPSFSFDDGAKANDIRLLKIGMNSLEVKRILGNPTEAYPSEEAIIDKNGTKQLLHPDRVTYRYNRYTPWGSLASKLYVHLDLNEISTVYGKRFDILGVDDYGVYFIRDDGENWESKEFENAFP